MKPIVAAVIAVSMFAAIAANAQDTAKQPDQTAAPEPYQPGLGEIMALQQMRHIKLWFAGAASNWPLADYEIGELQEGFDDVHKLLGGDVVEQYVGTPIATLQKAVDAKDRPAFIAAFDRLSAGCNACHHTLDHGFIVIARPAALPYSNQIFAPQK